MESSKYIIAEGAELRPYGPKSLIKAEDLTDELAELFIKKNPLLLGTVILKIDEKKSKIKKTEPTKTSKTKTKLNLKIKRK